MRSEKRQKDVNFVSVSWKKIACLLKVVIEQPRKCKPQQLKDARSNVPQERVVIWKAVVWYFFFKKNSECSSGRIVKNVVFDVSAPQHYLKCNFLSTSSMIEMTLTTEFTKCRFCDPTPIIYFSNLIRKLILEKSVWYR